MTSTLPDGTVIPSYLSSSTGGFAQDDGAFSDWPLRQGEVKEIIYRDDERSRTKRFTEYVVEVNFRDGRNPGVTTTYMNCLAANGFGGGGDSSRWTFRADSSQTQDSNAPGTGSKVTLLCINGERNSAIIIGGIDDDRQPEDEKDLGHHGFWEFNGSRAEVNDDGELTLSFRGATDYLGKLRDGVDEKVSGSKVQFLKDGSVLVQHDTQEIRIDHGGKKIHVGADQELNIDSNGHVVIKSAGVMVGDATDSWIKGTTYRAAESALFNQLGAAMVTLASQLAAAATGLIVTAPGAAAALTPAAPVLAQLAAAIQSFEAQAATYLSVKNKAD